MTVTDSETIGRRVAEARTRAGLTQVELAQAVGLDRSSLSKIEAGLRRITALELARIAEQTDESLEWFVVEPTPSIASYRHAGGSTTSSIDRMLEDISRDVELLQSLGQLDAAVPDPVTAPRDLDDAARLAASARRLLGASAGGPIHDLVGPLATVGLLAFSRDLGDDAPDAATILLARGAVSVINSGRGVGRRRLGLAHEFGHYLVADEYSVDWRVGAWTDRDRVEWLLDGFARALLLPAQAVVARWRELRTRETARDAAVRVASEFRVDMATLAARLSELAAVDEDDAATIRGARTTRSDIIEHDLVVPSDLEGTTLPRRYEQAVLTLYRAERVSADRAIELLRGTMDFTGLPTLAHVADEIWKFVS